MNKKEALLSIRIKLIKTRLQYKYGRINWHRHTVDTSSLLAKYYIILHSTQNITIQGRANIVEINYKGDTNIESALKTFKNDLKKACLI